ncbi:hypothetical protein FHX15_000859 [Rhizobium sp. BK650]|nr:hypothetical protein [Rhizobium sp. BK650]
MTPAAKYQVKYMSIYIGLILLVAVIITFGSLVFSR